MMHTITVSLAIITVVLLRPVILLWHPWTRSHYKLILPALAAGLAWRTHKKEVTK